MENMQITWDETEIAMFRAKEFLDSEIASTEEEAFEMAATDSDWLQWEFEDFKEQLKKILEDISPGGSYFVEGRNMGWRHLSGHAEIQALSVESYIEQTFPKTSDWTFQGNYDAAKKVLEYRLYHHDAPSGEIYYLSNNKQVAQRE